MAKQEADSQTSLGGFPPGMASRAHPGRQETCVGGPYMEATFAAVRRETKSKRSMREDSCPEHQWEKMQLDPMLQLCGCKWAFWALLDNVSYCL